MKVTFAVLLAVAAIGAYANVALFSAVDHVSQVIDEYKAIVQRLGLDPLYIEDEERTFSLVVPELFTAIGSAKEVNFKGLSDVDIKQLDYDAATNSVLYDIELPHIYGSAERGYGKVAFFDKVFTGELSGSFNIRSISFKGSIKFDGLVAVSAVVKSSVETIEADAKLVFEGEETYDVSERLNYFVNTRIPRGIENFQDDLDELFSIYAVAILNWHLDRSVV